MSSVRIFRRRRGGRPTGPWIAWGYDARGRRWTESTRQLSQAAALAVARELEARHASPAAARALADLLTVALGSRAANVQQPRAAVAPTRRPR